MPKATESSASFFSPPFLSSSEERLGGFLKELPSLQPLTIFPPCAAPFSQGLLGRILHALETFLAMLTLWEPLTVSLAFHLLDNFSTLVWLCLTTCWKRTSERILSFGALHVLVLCLTRFHQVLGWSSCLALSN